MKKKQRRKLPNLNLFIDKTIVLTKEKIIIYILICLGCVTISFNVAAIAAAVPVIALDLGLSDLVVAKIIPYYLIPYGLGALIYAPLTRFLSYRKVYVGSLLLYGVSCYICATSLSLESILIGRIGMGLTASSAIPLGLMLIGEYFEKQIRGRLVGFFFSCAFIASIAGLIVAGFAEWQWIFYVPAVLAGILALAFVIDRSKLLGEKHFGHINYLTVLSNRVILRVFSYIFILSFLYHGVHKWYGVYLSQEYGFDKQTISFFFILTVVGGMFGQIAGGVLSDKKGRVITCRIGVLGLAISVMLLFGMYSKWVLGVVLALISIFWTVGHNGVSTILTDFSHMDRPVIASLNSSVRFISGGLGFYVSSFFVKDGFGITFFVIGVLLLLASLLINKLIPR